jgi:hypothetical protein
LDFYHTEEFPHTGQRLPLQLRSVKQVPVDCCIGPGRHAAGSRKNSGREQNEGRFAKVVEGAAPGKRGGQAPGAGRAGGDCACACRAGAPCLVRERAPVDAVDGRQLGRHMGRGPGHAEGRGRAGFH